MDPVAMTQHVELASMSCCLANPGQERLLYLPNGGETTVEQF
jgi:hypothetical protein